MKKNQLAAWILLTVFLASLSGVAGAAAPVTVIPQGTVTVTEQGGKVMQMRSTFPLLEGSVMEAGKKPVTVRGPNFTFTADPASRFSISKTDDKWVLALYSGRVHYVLKKDTSLQFKRAGVEDAVYDAQKISPAADGKVSGQVSVAGEKLVFANTGGQFTLGSATGAKMNVWENAGRDADAEGAAGSTIAGVGTTTVVVGSGLAVEGAIAGIAAAAGSGGDVAPVSAK